MQIFKCILFANMQHQCHSTARNIPVLFVRVWWFHCHIRCQIKSIAVTHCKDQVIWTFWRVLAYWTTGPGNTELMQVQWQIPKLFINSFMPVAAKTAWLFWGYLPKKQYCKVRNISVELLLATLASGSDSLILRSVNICSIFQRFFFVFLSSLTRWAIDVGTLPVFFRFQIGQ